MPLERRVLFSSHLVWYRVSNHRKLVWNRVLLNWITHKILKSRTIEHYISLYRVTKCANLVWQRGRTFANPAAHPHPNYMGVPPPPPPGVSTKGIDGLTSPILNTIKHFLLQDKQSSCSHLIGVFNDNCT